MSGFEVDKGGEHADGVTLSIGSIAVAPSMYTEFIDPISGRSPAGYTAEELYSFRSFVDEFGRPRQRPA